MLFRLVVLRVEWRLPKPRTREAWRSWSDDDWNLRSDAVWDEEYRRQVRGEPSTVMLLPDGDLVAKSDPAAVAPVLSERARRRRELADRVFEDIRQTPARFPYRGADLLMATALPTSLEEAPGALDALRGVPDAIDRAGPGDVVMRSGPGGLMLAVHGPTWSVVARLNPYVRPVLVFVDSMSRFGWQVDDDPEAAGPIDDMVYGAMSSLRRFDGAGLTAPSAG